MEPENRELADIIDNLRRVFQVVNEHSKKAEKSSGITGPQLWAIKTISEKAPIRVSDLAHQMYLHPATVVGILDRLEARELVTRTRSSTDRRVVTIDLSEKGKELVRRAPEVAQGLLVAGLEKLSREKRKVIGEGLRYLVDILGVQEIPPKLMRSPEINTPE
ncbi:MAG: MarR family transcriptional regulator [Nitrospirota bacterium]|nr:MarR family transcriptional regulator [Nitrospirota bacterium]